MTQHLRSQQFEQAVGLYLEEQLGLDLQHQFNVDIGHQIKKPKRFDFGSEQPAVLVECKRYSFRKNGGTPNAKNENLTVALLELSVAPKHYRRMLFIAREVWKRVSLASRYLARYGHLVPPSIEIWEFDLDASKAQRLL